MAKSKLCIQVELRLREVKTSLKDVERALEKDQHLTPQVKDKVFNQFKALADAAYVLTNHLDKLKERESHPSVADRLRNAKNIFKNKEELSKKRAEMRHQYEDLGKKIGKYREGVKAAMNSQSPKEAMKNYLAEMERLESEAVNLDAKVDGLVAVLM
jgi:uncharacterized coiled-coil DUF342 family protein